MALYIHPLHTFIKAERKMSYEYNFYSCTCMPYQKDPSKEPLQNFHTNFFMSKFSYQLHRD